MDRRRLLIELSRLGLGLSFAPLVSRLLDNPVLAAATDPRPAKFWQPAGPAVECQLCPRQERLAPGDTGLCRVRHNHNGRLVTFGYDRPCVLNVDPIEKNPLTHVMPGAEMLAIAHAGCNLRCMYCQNWQYSQASPRETRNISDFDQRNVVGKAATRNLRGLVFTYTEGGVCPEFVADVATLAAEKKLMLTLCTCGYLLEKPFRQLLAPFAAVTITYKGPTEQFYTDVCQARLAPVLDSMLRVKEEKKWLEVATLIVPTMNDDEVSLRTMAKWIAKNLGEQTPWHLERFMPQYKLTNLPPTPQATLEQARRIGFDVGLKHVYISNLAPHEGNHTYCPRCRKAVILRLGFKVLKNEMAGGRCPSCHTALSGIWA